MTESPLACPRCHQVFLPSQSAPFPPPLPAYPAPPRPVLAPPRPRGSRLGAPSVPTILLGLGAVALLVAAALFLAVAWASLGTAGRTAVLLALTAASGAAGQWATARGLRVAGESLTTVALGLAVLDVLGGASAGWLGADAGWSSVGAALGGVLLTAGLALSVPRERLAVPQLAAPLGLALLAVSALADADPRATFAAVAAGTLALAGLGRVVEAPALRWTGLAYAATATAALALAALVGGLSDPSLAALWTDEGWWLLGVVALVQLARTALPAHRQVTWTAHAVSGAVLTVAAALPVADEGLTAITLAAAGATLAWAAVARIVPRDALAVPVLPLLGAVPALAAAPLLLAGQAVLLLAGERPEPLLDPAPWLLPLAAAALAAAGLLAVPHRATRWAALVTVAVAGWLTLPLYDQPLWLSVAIPLAVAAALVVTGREAWAAPALLVALGVAVPEPAMTTAVLAVTVGAALLTLRRSESAALLPVAVTALLWTVGELADVEAAHRSLAAVAVVGLLALALPRVELEALGWASVLVAATLGLADAERVATLLAVHLTLAGALLTASALIHRERRGLGWLGGAVLALATWVRLADLGVQAPEAYTLPTAAALVLVGLDRLRRDPGADTVVALLPGLALAVVPSLLWALADPLSTRALVVGLACLALVLLGTSLRWTAPVLVGAVAGGLLVLRELAPYAAQTPQWLVIGAAGTVLVAVGVTWEARLRDLRQVAGYVERLR